MNASLPSAFRLFTSPTGREKPLGGVWRVALPDPTQMDNESFAEPDYLDEHWKKVQLPHLRYATHDRDVVWYRHRFHLDPLPAGEHLLVRLGGAFYQTRVWLNGVCLGEHQGYFQPFGFDLTPHLKTGENVLAVRCHFPVEAGALKSKTTLTGYFADWDCKPYPSPYYPNLPAPHEWRVPVGLWQPVQLQTNGPLLVEAFNLFPSIDQPNWETSRAESARVRVIVQIRNLTNQPQPAFLRLTFTPHNFQGPAVECDPWSISVNALSSQRFEFEPTLLQPQLWFPWTHGVPHLYRAGLSLYSPEFSPQNYTQVFGVRSIEAQMDAHSWTWILNGRRIFPRGSNYVSDFYLDRVTPKKLGHDLLLAREANQDLLRVHAHIASDEIYRQCDEQGMLLICDFPQIWSYAYGLPAEEQDHFQHGVLRQAEDMVLLLGSHPSIVTWILHNEPPWMPEGGFLGADVHDSQNGYAIDQAAAERVRQLDPTRPALAASGELDQHLYHGWYTGHWSDNRLLAPSFPTEFGVQALPNSDSPFWETVNTTWPVHRDDPTWAYADYQPMFFENPGIGLPAQYPTLGAYIRESQAYQAFYIRYVIDQWRRKKFEPVGGYAYFQFNDGWPAITWSVLDYDRHPKAGYRALAEVSSPTHVCIDLTGNYHVEGAFHLVYPREASFAADLYLVNDDYRMTGNVELRWWFTPQSSQRFAAWLRSGLAARTRLALPRADAGALRVKSVVKKFSRAGQYTFHTQLLQNGIVIDENHSDFSVGVAPAPAIPMRRVPSFLISRVYTAGSLQATADGFMFRFHNSVMPVLIQELSELQIDGQVIQPDQVELIHCGQTHEAAQVAPEAPMEFSAGESLLFVIHAPLLAPGTHKLEVTLQFYGIGKITAAWSDNLA